MVKQQVKKEKSTPAKAEMVDLMNRDVYKLLHSSLFAGLVGREDLLMPCRGGLKKLYHAVITSDKGKAYKELIDELKKPHADEAKAEFDEEAQAEFDKKTEAGEKDVKLRKITPQQLEMAADNRLSDTEELEEFLELSFGLSVEKVPIVIDNKTMKVSVQQEANHDWIFDFTTKG